MNAYEMNKESYEALLKKNPDDPQADYFRMKIKVNGILAECSPEERCELYNTGAFNEITAGYAEKSMREHGFSDEDIEKVLSGIHRLHDSESAQQILASE